MNGMDVIAFTDHRSHEAGRAPEERAWPDTHFRAMGSDFGLWLDADPVAARQAFRQARTIVDGLEQRMSRFLPDSELNRLNRAAGRPVTVSPELYDVIHRAVDMACRTHGLFDPTLLDDLKRAGYDRSLDQLGTDRGLPTPPPPDRVQRAWEGIALRPDDMTVTLPAGAGLDLGGIGKGYTAQVVADFLGKVGPCLVDAGGDLVAGEAPRGCDGWPVSVAAPFQGEGSPERDILGLWLHDAALTTSGVDRRRWVRDGQVYHHLLDPLTGTPASSGLITVSVEHPNGPTAEALATAALVAGADRGANLIEAAGGGGLLVTETGQYHLAGTWKHNVQWQLPVIGVQNEKEVTYYGY